MVKDNGWNLQKTKAMREKIMWIILFFLLDFDEIAHDLG